MSKILIALQFWEGDRAKAYKLVDFIADTTDSHVEDADFLLVNRFDCDPLAETLMLKLARKINVRAYKSPRRGIGWPTGCNEMWLATMEWAYSMLGAKMVPPYKAIFCCEADGGPVNKDWIARLSKEWDMANAKQPVVIAGPIVNVPGHNGLDGEHINGNALISADLNVLRWLTREIIVSPNVGWDFVLAPVFKQRGWSNIPGIRSYYNSPSFSRLQYAQMIADDLIWVHGDKSNSLCDWGRHCELGFQIDPKERLSEALSIIKAPNEYTI